ncbi:MAG: acetyl-coenzyme A synthetase N-terminal domain-containing protein, partial [Ilumatobacteraceae bacterium]
MADQQHTIDALLSEQRTFPPSEAFRAGSLLSDSGMHDEAGRDVEGFWARQAAELLTWHQPWHTTCEWDLPFAKWFVGG